MKNHKTSHITIQIQQQQSPYRTKQSIMIDSPNKQLDESSNSNSQIPKIESQQEQQLNQEQQIRKQIADERAPSKGCNSNEFNPKMFITKDLKESDIIDMKQVSDYYDTEQAGILFHNDLEQLLINFGYHPTKQTLYEMDEDEFGDITFEQYLTILNYDKTKSQKKDTIRRINRKNDKNKNGYITLQDLRQVVYKDLKEDIDEEVLDKIFRKTDSKQDGKMSFEDFYNVITKKVYF